MIPKQFSELWVYAAKWTNSYRNDLHHARQITPLGEIREFYDAMQPQLDPILSYRDSFELSAVPEEAKTLPYLTFGFYEHGAWPV